ncbi:hypothetical protein LCGC14_1345180 [marine sediment metagenome]|uniref:Terminase small subunit n=1 Tax=marine sediment metagenome TaxID=412755 RepID=A0A0F9NEY1_9ZZZZ
MVNQKLTRKQEGFTLDLFQGLSETAAYKNNYSIESMSKGAIYVEACRLAANPKVSLRLDKLRQPQANSTKMLVAEREERLSEIGREDIISAKGTPLRGPNITAIRELNQMDGVYPPEKHALLGAIDLVVRYKDKNEEG